ncbi:hypothetical protein Tco_1303394 [Tanacetum coccineum]
MATKVAVRYVSRRFSSGGKILSEEEKAAENIYIKKMEQERLEKLARKGQKAEGTSASSGGADAKASESTASTSSTTDKNRNYAVIAGVVTGLGALGWYLKSKNKKTDELQD